MIVIMKSMFLPDVEMNPEEGQLSRRDMDAISEDAFSKIAARVKGTAMAAERLQGQSIARSAAAHRAH